jgi:hypothetical protein
MPHPSSLRLTSLRYASPNLVSSLPIYLRLTPLNYASPQLSYASPLLLRLTSLSYDSPNLINPHPTELRLDKDKLKICIKISNNRNKKLKKVSLLHQLIVTYGILKQYEQRQYLKNVFI